MTKLVAGVFSPMAPSEDGERAERSLIRCSAPKMEDDIVRARSGVDEFASHETTLRLSYGFGGELTVY